MALKKYINDLFNLDCNWYNFSQAGFSKQFYEQERSTFIVLLDNDLL